MPKPKARVARLRNLALRAGRLPDPLLPENKQQLEVDGFTIIDYVRDGKNDISFAKRQAIINAIFDNGSFIVNNSANGSPGDYSRLMMGVEPRDVQGKLAMKVAKKLIKTFPHLRLGKATYLTSREHGHDQLPHIDTSNPNGTLRAYVQKQMVPLSVIITYKDPAVLNIWKGSHNVVWADSDNVPKGKCFGERVMIPPFSALVFRQDLVHSGTAYESPNLRLHFFLDLDVDDYSDDPSSIRLMDKSYFRMKPL